MVFLFVFFKSLFQAEDSSEQLNFSLPVSLLPFKHQIDNVFEKEFKVLCKKSRFEIFFRNIKVKPVFTNRTNVKKLIVKTKINWTKAYELWIASSQTISRSVGSCKSKYNSGNKLQKLRHIQKNFFTDKSSIISHHLYCHEKLVLRT